MSSPREKLEFKTHPERDTLIANSGARYLLDRQYRRAVLRAGADVLITAGIPPILRNLTDS